MNEIADVYKRAIPHGARIVLEKSGQHWIATLHAAGRTVRWDGPDPDDAVASLARAWMAQWSEATSKTT